MFSIVIATLDCERVLVPTLATLVAGAAAGTLRDVIIADGGSRDATREIGDMAGCEVLVQEAPLAGRLRAAAATARGPWLIFLQPGVVLETTWVEESRRFVEQAEFLGQTERAAVFRRVPAAGAARPALMEALGLLRAALGARPRPDQGLIISKQHYQRLGGHRDGVADTEADLIARLGRRRIALLRSGAVAAHAPFN